MTGSQPVVLTTSPHPPGCAFSSIPDRVTAVSRRRILGEGSFSVDCALSDPFQIGIFARKFQLHSSLAIRISASRTLCGGEIVFTFASTVYSIDGGIIAQLQALVKGIREFFGGNLTVSPAFGRVFIGLGNPLRWDAQQNRLFAQLPPLVQQA